MPKRPQRYRPPQYRSYDQQRGTAAQRGYDSKWEKARKLFLAENPLCLPCKQAGGFWTRAEATDHVLRHRGDMQVFWDESNWQPICRPCHKIKTDLECGNTKREKVSLRYVVTGPPGSGKTTWVQRRAQDDWLVWDMDKEAENLGFAPRYPRPEAEIRTLKIRRAWLLSRLVFDSVSKAALIVTDESEAEFIAGIVGAQVIAPRFAA